MLSVICGKATGVSAEMPKGRRGTFTRVTVERVNDACEMVA